MNSNFLTIANIILLQYVPTVFTAIGVVGNSLVFYILTREKFLKESIFRYFLCSEAVASLSIITAWMYAIPVYLKWNISTFYCKIIIYILYILNNFYPWVNAINSIDRLLSIKYPGKDKIFKKFKFQALFLTSTFSMLAIINLPHYIYGGMSNATSCGITSNSVRLHAYSLNLLVSVVLPFSIMFISTFLVLNLLIAQKNKVSIKSYRREKNFLKSILTMDLWFLGCYSPFCVITLLRETINFSSSYSFKMAFDLFASISFIGITCNFFILCLCNKLFKNYFLSMIRCRSIF